MEDILLPINSTSYWTTGINVKSYPIMDDNEKADVGIVGAGLTGLTAAYILSQAGYSVCLIDAAHVLSGTTAHTTGKVTAQHGLIYHELTQHFGLEEAKSYYKANAAALDFMKNLVHQKNIECEWQELDACLYATTQEEMRKLEEEIAAYKKLEIQGDVSTAKELPFSTKKKLNMPAQASFHPLKYADFLLSECEKSGVKIYEQTRAVGVEHQAHPNIVTEHGYRIICNHIIQASHYPFHDGEGYFPMNMYASRSYLLAVQTEEVLDDMYLGLGEGKASRTIRPIRIGNNDCMLVGGCSHKTGQGNESTLSNHRELAAFADQNFGLKKVLYRWSAQDYVTLDKLPYIGRTIEHEKGVYVATGFRKWGITGSTNAALIIADMIMEKENPLIQLFSPKRAKRLDPALKNIVSYNADVVKHLIKGKSDLNDEQLENLKQNEACVIRRQGKRIGVYKDSNNQLYGVDTTCTHLGCEVNWNDAEKSWDCPCHGSRYTYEGEVINGPAVQALNQINLSEQ